MLLTRIPRNVIHRGLGIRRRALNQRSKAGASLLTSLDVPASPRRSSGSSGQARRQFCTQGPAASPRSTRHYRGLHQPNRGSTPARLPWRSSMPAAAEDDSVQQADAHSRNDSAMAATRSQRVVAIAGLAVAATIVTVFLGRQGFDLQQTAEAIQTAIRDHPSIGPLIFIAAYAVAAVVLIPASLLTLAAGYLFGPIYGTAIVSAAATLGATLAFFVSRYVARPLVLDRIGSNPRFQQVSANVDRKGALMVLLLRLSPLVPFGLLNYMLGLTGIPALSFILCSWVGMLPGTIAYVYLGSIGQAAQSGLSPVKLSLYIVGGIATLGASKVIADIAGQQLRTEDSSPEAAQLRDVADDDQ